MWQTTLACSCSWIRQNSANAHLKSGDFSYRAQLKSGDFSYGGHKTLPHTDNRSPARAMASSHHARDRSCLIDASYATRRAPGTATTEVGRPPPCRTLPRKSPTVNVSNSAETGGDSCARSTRRASPRPSAACARCWASTNWPARRFSTPAPAVGCSAWPGAVWRTRPLVRLRSAIRRLHARVAPAFLSRRGRLDHRGSVGARPRLPPAAWHVRPRLLLGRIASHGRLVAVAGEHHHPGCAGRTVVPGHLQPPALLDAPQHDSQADLRLAAGVAAVAHGRLPDWLPGRQRPGSRCHVAAQSAGSVSQLQELARHVVVARLSRLDRRLSIRNGHAGPNLRLLSTARLRARAPHDVRRRAGLQSIRFSQGTSRLDLEQGALLAFGRAGAQHGGPAP